MGEEEPKGKKGPRPGGTWVWIDKQRKQAMPFEENVTGPEGTITTKVRWKLLDGRDVTDLIGKPPKSQPASSPDGHLHMQMDDPVKVIIVTEAEGLNCLENLFYLTDAMKQIADEMTKIREILEADPKVRENLRVAKELQKAEAMKGRGT